MRHESLAKSESKTITARVPEWIAAEIDREAERLGEGQSVAIRSLLRQGIATRGTEGLDDCAH